MILTYLNFDIGPADVVHRRFLQVCLIIGIIRLDQLTIGIFVVFIIIDVFFTIFILLYNDSLSARRVILVRYFFYGLQVSDTLFTALVIGS